MQPSASRFGETSQLAPVSAPVLEVFASIQGEGLFVGRPQVFVRLYGCPLRCTWCDTPGSWKVPERHATEGEELFLTPFQVATRVAALDPEGARAVSLTGGEPLVWPAFVAELSTYLGDRPLHLETAGAHPSALKQVLDQVDHVSCDLKLPADMAAPVPLAGEGEPVPATEPEWARVRRDVLKLLKEQSAALKLVVAGEREPEDFEPILDDILRFAPELPLVLQPVTPMAGVSAPGRAVLMELVELAIDRELDVRVLPQVHRALRIP